MSVFAHTDKQSEILNLVLKAADAGEFIDLETLRNQLSYGREVSSQAVQCSINFLVRHGLVEKAREVRRGRRRLIIKPTPQTYAALRQSVP